MEMTMIEAINLALRQAMEKDERVLLLGEDIGKNGGVFRVTDGLMDSFGEKRVVDTPIAESGIVGAAIGLATRGLLPIAEIQFFGFIYQAMDQMAGQAARMHFRSGGVLNVPMVVRSPYGGGVGTPELHSDSLESLFLHSPGLKIVMPSTPYDAKGLLTSAIQDENPVLFLEPMKLYRTLKEEVPEEAFTIPIGEAKVVTEGTDVTVISWGPPVHLVKSVAQKMNQEKNISIEVLDLRTIAPLDETAIIQSVEKTGRAVIVHEAVKTGGVGAEIAALISEKAVYSLESPIRRVAGFDTPYPFASIENEWLPTTERIEQSITEVLKE